MKSIPRCWRGAARAVVLASAGLSFLTGPAELADAHARVKATVPADGEVVDAPPDRVTIVLEAKPATVEGDPLRVYGPMGDRVDAGDTELVTDGETSALSVGLPPEGARSAGDYHVAYRVVSADSHLIAGHFSFMSRRPVALGPADTAGLSAPAPERLAYDRPHHDPWPKAVSAAGVALAALVAGGRRWGRSRRDRQRVVRRERVSRRERASQWAGVPARRERASQRAGVPVRRRATTAGLGASVWTD